MCNSPRRTTALLAAAALVAALTAGDGARASVPAGTPVFTTPLTIDNTYFPFVPGAVKVSRGKDGSDRTTVVDIYRSETREFTVGAATVACRVLQETEFANGEVAEISTNWFAQADDGSVWYFGEIVDAYENGVVTGHGGSWLVDGPSGGDPPETMNVASPGLFMPANPEVGDEFRPEDLPDGSVEVDTVARLARKVRTPAGQFDGCLEIGELTPSTGERETKWYAPGQGVVKAKGQHELLLLEASTIPQ